MEKDRWLEYLKNFDSLVDYYKKKYGTNSEVVYALMLELLATQLFVQSKVKRKDLDKQFSHTYHELMDIINHLEIPTGNYKPMYKCSDGSIEFDMEYYKKTYDGQWEYYKEGIVELDGENFLEYATFKWHVYVLTKTNKMLIFEKPFSQLEILFGREGVPKHVILAHNSNLKVLCAGEILIGKDKRNQLVIIINNRSGHYRPDGNNLLMVKKYLEKYTTKICCIDCSKGKNLNVCGS